MKLSAIILHALSLHRGTGGVPLSGRWATSYTWRLVAFAPANPELDRFMRSRSRALPAGPGQDAER